MIISTRYHRNYKITVYRHRFAMTILACVLAVATLWAQAPSYTHRFLLPSADFPVAHAFVSNPQGDPFRAEITKNGTELHIRIDTIDRIALHLLASAGPAGTLMVTADKGGLGYPANDRAYDLVKELYFSAAGEHPPGDWSAGTTMRKLGQVLVEREEALLRKAQNEIERKKYQTRQVDLSSFSPPPVHKKIIIRQKRTYPPLGFGQGFYEKAPYRKHTGPLFDYVVLPFYLPEICSAPGQYDWSAVERTARWCRDNGLGTQGSPLIWFFDELTPDWLRAMNYDQLKKWTCDHVTANVTHFKGLIDQWVVVNEAHGWANSLNLTEEQLIEITDIAARAARQANPDCQVILNCCLPWGDYVQRHKSAADSMTPYTWFRRMIHRDCPFDVIGLQMYNAYEHPFPHRDLVAMSALIDRFGAMGKPIHISEFSTPSGGDTYGVWRGQQWTPELQAEYTRGFYQIACAKPFVENITWWFPIDVPSTAWRDLGLVTADNRPKPALETLLDLKRSWLTDTTATTNGQGRLVFKGMAGLYELSWEQDGQIKKIEIEIDGRRDVQLISMPGACGGKR